MHMMMWIVLLGAFMATAPSVVSAGDTIQSAISPTSRMSKALSRIISREPDEAGSNNSSDPT